MKSTFPGYYRPSDEEFDQLWNDCIFFFDSNVLLNLYKYSPETTEEFLQLLEKIKERAWIPHQVGKEYHNKRMEIIIEEERKYKKYIKVIQDKKEEIEKAFKEDREHPFAEDNIQKEISDHFEAIISLIEKAHQKAHPYSFDKDNILDRLTKIFSERVGQPPDDELVTRVERDGGKRYEQKIPPGYKDEEMSRLSWNWTVSPFC